MFHVKQFIFFIFFVSFLSNSKGQGTKQAIFEVKELPNWPIKDSVILKPLLKNPLINGDPQVLDMFYWTNYSRKYPKIFWSKIVEPFLNIYPQFRTTFATSLKNDLFNLNNALPLLEPDSLLFCISKKHAKDLQENWPTISHNSSKGKTFTERLEEVGFFDCAGENISVGNTEVVLQLIFLYIDEGLSNLGHRKALLNQRFKRMGVSKEEAGDSVILFVQDFSCN